MFVTGIGPVRLVAFMRPSSRIRAYRREVPKRKSLYTRHTREDVEPGFERHLSHGNECSLATGGFDLSLPRLRAVVWSLTKARGR